MLFLKDDTILKHSLEAGKPKEVVQIELKYINAGINLSPQIKFMLYDKVYSIDGKLTD